MNATKKRFDPIDLVRALAIIGVLLFHYAAEFQNDYMRWKYHGPAFSYGYLGVYVFFILSGYCIYLTIRSSQSISEFLAKRLSRIWPALFVGACITFIVKYYFGLPGTVPSLNIFLQNITLLFVATEKYVDGAYWSIMVELKFYLFFGLIYFFNHKKIAEWWSYFTWAGCVAFFVSHLLPYLGISYAGHIVEVLSRKIFLAPYSHWFLLGIVIFEWKEREVLEKIKLLLPLITFLALNALFSNWFESLLMTVFSFTLIYLIPNTTLRIPLPVRFIGLISYPLYLVHQDIGRIVIHTLSPLSSVVSIGTAIGVSVLLAVFIHTTVEWRFRKPVQRISQQIIEQCLLLIQRSRHLKKIATLYLTQKDELHM